MEFLYSDYFMMSGCMLQSSVVELDSLQQYQETVLMVAARKGRLEIVRRLIEHGVRVNSTNKVYNWWTPYCCSRMHMWVKRKYESFEAAILSCKQQGKTVGMIA